MIDPLIVIGVVVGWATVAAVVYQMLRSEVWHLRTEADQFHKDNVGMVNRLKSKAELALVSTIYNLETLKAIYARPHASSGNVGTLTQVELDKVGSELTTFTKGIDDVREPKAIFDAICEDYKKREKDLTSVVQRGVAYSVVIPLAFIAADLVQGNEWLVVILVAVLILYFGGIGTTPIARNYSRTCDRLEKNHSRLRTLVDTRIYELGERQPLGPPAAPGTSPEVAMTDGQQSLDTFREIGDRVAGSSTPSKPSQTPPDS